MNELGNCSEEFGNVFLEKKRNLEKVSIHILRNFQCTKGHPFISRMKTIERKYYKNLEFIKNIILQLGGTKFFIFGIFKSSSINDVTPDRGGNSRVWVRLY